MLASLRVMMLSTIGFGPVSQPHRDPGATILENESSRITRPSTSMERNDEMIGDAAPLGRIWRKQSGRVSGVITELRSDLTAHKDHLLQAGDPICDRVRTTLACAFRGWSLQWGWSMSFRVI